MPLPGWEVRGTAEDKVELLARSQCVGRTEVCQPDLVACLEAVVSGGPRGQADALLLRFNRHEPGAGQAPCRHHSDRPDAGSEVEHLRGRGAHAVPSTLSAHRRSKIGGPREAETV